MYNKTKTHFSSIIRIRPDQLAWLKENKDTKTVAGFLDKIINQHKHGNSKSTLPNETRFIILESEGQKEKKERYRGFTQVGNEVRKEWF